MNKIEEALACFRQGYNCAQAVLSAFGPELGLDRGLALRLAHPFGAGIGRMARTCGAVSGAYMVIGLKAGTADLADQAAKEKAYALAREFTRKFTERNGSVICRELLGQDLSTPEGLKKIFELKLFETTCLKMVQDAVEVLEEIL